MGNIANLFIQLRTRGAVNHIELQHMQPVHFEIYADPVGPAAGVNARGARKAGTNGRARIE